MFPWRPIQPPIGIHPVQPAPPPLSTVVAEHASANGLTIMVGGIQLVWLCNSQLCAAFVTLVRTHLPAKARSLLQVTELDLMRLGSVAANVLANMHRRVKLRNFYGLYFSLSGDHIRDFADLLQKMVDQIEKRRIAPWNARQHSTVIRAVIGVRHASWTHPVYSVQDTTVIHISVTVTDEIAEEFVGANGSNTVTLTLVQVIEMKEAQVESHHYIQPPIIPPSCKCVC
jgi:hypothetical protein